MARHLTLDQEIEGSNPSSPAIPRSRLARWVSPAAAGSEARGGTGGGKSAGAWRPAKDGDPVGLALYERHYSARRFHDDRRRRLFVGPGEKLVLVACDGRAVFAWRRFVSDAGELGVNCAVFRNEGSGLSSDLITEADAIAWDRWPDERLYTYVDAASVASPNPGYCFKMAGWRSCGRTKGGHGRRPQEILEMLPAWASAIAA